MALHRRPKLWQLRHTWYVAQQNAEDNMGLRCTPETKHFIYFYLGHCAILLFKTQ